MDNNNIDLSAIWQIMLTNMRDDHVMPDTALDLWFGDLKLVFLSSDKVIFETDSSLKKDIIEKKYAGLLSQYANSVIGFTPEIEITVPPVPTDTSFSELIRNSAENAAADQEQSEFSDIFNNDDDANFIESQSMMNEEYIIAEHLANQAGIKPIHSNEKKLSFNPEYTFENFIVGSSNNLAHAAALSVSENPGKEYNPLFIYGNSGLGKTHLMYAIANRVLENNPKFKVIYVKGEEFTNQLIEALRFKKNIEFREKYRKADMLLIDDIQFISGKESTQEEFFHTFNALYEDGKQLIITSDKPPREMTTLEERIRSRFEGGLIVDIQPPDFELRLAILKNKAEKNNLEIPNDVITFLAENLQSNIRQIEGVIKKLGANHFLSGLPITMEMLQTSIPEFIKSDKSDADIARNIVICVAKRFNTTPDEIYGRKRNKEIKNARNVSMKIIRDITSLSLPKIGALMGNRDYSTVHSNLNAVDKQVSTDPDLENMINDIIKEVRNM